MAKTVLSPLENLRKTEAMPENEEEIRELICRVLSEDKSEEAKRTCLKKIRELVNEKLIQQKKAEYSYFDLAGFIRSLCLCSDIVFGQNGRRISFEIQEISLAACSKTLATGFFNLLSNAARFSSDGPIEVSLKEAGMKAVITVKNRGNFDFEKDSFKKGLAAAENAARLHKGTLFVSASSGNVAAALSLSLFLKPTAKTQPPLFPELLTDEFSCVYVGLCDVEENNGYFV